MSTKELDDTPITEQPVNDKHISDLRASGLDDATRKAAGFRSVTNVAEAAKILKWDGKDGPVPSLKIPIFDINGEVVAEMLRSDVPHVGIDGARRQYGWPLGVPFRIYFPPPPLVPASAWGDISVPLLVTEGVKKALVAAQAGFAAIAAPGDYLFQKVEDQSGGPGWTLHPDLVGVQLRDRDVYIALDSGETIVNSNVVRFAEARLAKMLRGVGAQVEILRIPSEPGKGKVGLDDYLMTEAKGKRSRFHDVLAKLIRRKTVQANLIDRAGEPLKEEDKEDRANAIEKLLNEPDFQAGLAVADKHVVDLVFNVLKGKGGPSRKAYDHLIVSFRNALAVARAEEKEVHREFSPEIRKKAKALLRDPDLVNAFVRRVHHDGLTGEDLAIKALLLVGVSRKLDEPIHVVIKASSSTGKNFTVNKVLSCFPPEDVKEVSDITPHALQNMDEGLSGKVVVITEAEGSKDAAYPLRVVMSERKISVLVPERDPETGKMGTVRREVDARAAFITTTTRTKLHNENETRILELVLDESKEQTKRIIRAKAKLVAHPPSPRRLARREEQRIVWRAAMGLIKPCKVCIPQAEQLAEEFPHNQIKMRRAYPRLLGLIEASTLLHRKQRKKNGDGYLLSQDEDVNLAREITTGLSGNLTPKLDAVMKTICTFWPNGFEAEELADRFGTDGDQARRYLRDLEAREYVYVDRKKGGPNAALWKVSNRIALQLEWDSKQAEKKSEERQARRERKRRGRKAKKKISTRHHGHRSTKSRKRRENKKLKAEKWKQRKARLLKRRGKHRRSKK